MKPTLKEFFRDALGGKDTNYHQYDRAAPWVHREYVSGEWKHLSLSERLRVLIKGEIYVEHGIQLSEDFQNVAQYIEIKP